MNPLAPEVTARAIVVRLADQLEWGPGNKMTPKRRLKEAAVTRFTEY